MALGRQEEQGMLFSYLSSSWLLYILSLPIIIFFFWFNTFLRGWELRIFCKRFHLFIEHFSQYVKTC